MADNTDFLDEIVEDENQNVNPGDALLPENEDSKESSSLKGVDPSVIADLEKKSKGFYDNMKEERRKRQDIQSELDRIKGTVAAILEMRKQPAALAELGPKPKFNGLPVAETEDGDLYVPSEQLNTVIAPYQQKIEALEQRLQQSNLQQNVESETAKVLQSIVGEDESFGPAFQKYQAARKWVNDRVIEYQRENGIRGPMTSGQALDTVFSDDHVEQEFAKKFPGFAVEDVVQAEDSQRLFRRTMKNIASVLQPKIPDKITNERFQKVLKKPAGLGNATNAKGASLSISEKLGDLSPSDIMSLTDAQAKALERALLEEEKTDGLIFSR